MTETTLRKIAKNNDYTVKYKKYRYWTVLFINNTAICFDYITEDNSENICVVPKYFPKFVTKEYVRNAIENNAKSLGVIDYRNKNKFGGKIYFKFDEKIY